jgi:hypothetical protein
LFPSQLVQMYTVQDSNVTCAKNTLPFYLHL